MFMPMRTRIRTILPSAMAPPLPRRDFCFLRSFLCLCFRIFFRRFLRTLDMNDLLTWTWGSTLRSTWLREPWLGTTEPESLSRKEPDGRKSIGALRRRRPATTPRLPGRPLQTRPPRMPLPPGTLRPAKVRGTTPPLAWASELPPLFRAHVAPPFPELLTPLRRKAPEPALALADRLLPLRRQLAKPLVPFPELLPSLRGELLPPLEILPGFHPLFGGHGQPALGPVAQPLLALRRQLVPGIREGLEHALLFAAQLLERNPRALHLSAHRRGRPAQH